jgi:uncharacterized membrane protein
VVLRPYAGALEPPSRLALWHGVFARFFPWVWASIAALLISGYGMVFLAMGGFAGAGVHVHVMNLTGLIMIALFLHLYFAPWRRLKRAVEAGDHADAARHLGQIRMIVAINLGLGLLTSVIGASGRYWG